MYVFSFHPSMAFAIFDYPETQVVWILGVRRVRVNYPVDEDLRI